MMARYGIALLLGAALVAAMPGAAQERSDVETMPETVYKLAIGRVTGVDLEQRALSLPGGRVFHFDSDLVDEVERVRVGMAVNVIYERGSAGNRMVEIQVLPPS